MISLRTTVRRFQRAVRDDGIGLATKWLRILSLGGNGNIRNDLVASPFFSIMVFVAWHAFHP